MWPLCITFYVIKVRWKYYPWLVKLTFEQLYVQWFTGPVQHRSSNAERNWFNRLFCCLHAGNNQSLDTNVESLEEKICCISESGQGQSASIRSSPTCSWEYNGRMEALSDSHLQLIGLLEAALLKQNRKKRTKSADISSETQWHFKASLGPCGSPFEKEGPAYGLNDADANGNCCSSHDSWGESQRRTPVTVTDGRRRDAQYDH